MSFAQIHKRRRLSGPCLSSESSEPGRISPASQPDEVHSRKKVSVDPPSVSTNSKEEKEEEKAALVVVKQEEEEEAASLVKEEEEEEVVVVQKVVTPPAPVQLRSVPTLARALALPPVQPKGQLPKKRPATTTTTTSTTTTANQQQPTKLPTLCQYDLDALPKLLFVELLSGQPDVVAAAMKKLCILVAGNGNDQKINRETIKTLGGHAMIVPAMKRHALTHDVQSYACHCIAFYAGEDTQIALALAHSGAYEAVMNALMVHPNSLPLHVVGCNAFQALLGNTSSVPGRHNYARFGRRFVLELRGIPLIMEAMKRFPNNGTLQYQACNCLTQILHHTVEAKAPMKDSGVTSWIACNVEKHPQDKLLQQSAAEFMVAFFGGGSHTSITC